jgi:hypothetical protein
MDNPQTVEFRHSVRLMILEHLAIKTAFEGLVLNHRKSIPEARQSLKDWLDANGAVIDRTYGEYFGDPGMTALYADEANDVIEKLKGVVDKFAAEIKN